MKTKKKQTKKTEEVGRCPALQWRKQTVYNVCLFFLTYWFIFFSWWELCVVRLYWLRARGHHSRGHVHEPPPKSTLGVGLGVGWWRRGGVASEAMCRTWAPPRPGELRLGGLLPLLAPHSLPLWPASPDLLTKRGGREEDGESRGCFFWWGGRGTYQTWPKVVCLLACC